MNVEKDKLVAYMPSDEEINKIILNPEPVPPRRRKTGEKRIVGEIHITLR